MSQIALPDLGTVQQTMLVPLYARAVENRQPVPIIRDRKALEIVREFDEEIEPFRHFPRTMLGCCIRAMVFDGWIRKFLAETSESVVVEIGPGMDTTFERMDDGRVLWFEIDFPDVIGVRRRFFQETDRRRFLSGSVLSGHWVPQVRSSGRDTFLFQAAGVLTYFSEEEVRQLFTMVANEFPGALFLFDACTCWAQRNAFRWEPTLQLTDAEFRWGIDDPRSIQDWDPRFEVLHVEHHVDHFAYRWPLWLRIAKHFIPAIRRSFSLTMVRLG